MFNFFIYLERTVQVVQQFTTSSNFWEKSIGVQETHFEIWKFFFFTASLHFPGKLPPNFAYYILPQYGLVNDYIYNIFVISLIVSYQDSLITDAEVRGEMPSSRNWVSYKQ